MDGQQSHAPGGHYSGRNPIPNIKNFVESLDRDKKDRDRQIEEQQKHQADPSKHGEVKPHVEDAPSGVKGSQKEVTDPVTGRTVTIENVNKDFMKAVDDPQLSVPNANLGRPTVSMTGSESYGHKLIPS
jgi:hypothetical protein